ncbi:hypothetical protein GP486_008431, partial [Trichoglossum hirsutum]
AHTDGLKDHIPSGQPVIQALVRLAHLRLPPQHHQLPQLHHLVAAQAGLPHLAGLLQTGRQAVYHHDAAPAGVLVVVAGTVQRRHGLLQDLGVQLAHVPLVAPDGDDQPALAAALDAGEVLGGEQRLDAGGTAEDGVGLPHFLFQHARVLAVLPGEHAELGAAPPLRALLGVEPLQQRSCPRETAVDDVHVLYVVAAQ